MSLGANMKRYTNYDQWFEQEQEKAMIEREKKLKNDLKRIRTDMNDPRAKIDYGFINNMFTEEKEPGKPALEKPFSTVSLFDLTCECCGGNIPAGTDYIYDNSRSLCMGCGYYEIQSFNKRNKKATTNQYCLSL